MATQKRDGKKPTSSSAPSSGTVRRRDQLRLREEAVARVRSGHPWVFRDALGKRQNPSLETGEIVTLTDRMGQFVARGHWEAQGAVAVRVLSRDPGVRPNVEFYRQLAEDAVRRRRDLLAGDLTAYRILHGEGDGLPGLTVDRFGDFLMAQLYTMAMAQPAKELYPALLEMTGAQGLYEQQRLRPMAGERRPPAERIVGAKAPLEQEVVEHGCRFLVDVTAPTGVGLFPDLREVRRWVGARAADCRVLNLFSYTGAFSVHALLGGARSVTAVDLSAKTHAWARRNLKQNGLDPETCRTLDLDVIVATERLRAAAEQFELIIVDPPGFSRSRRGTFSSARDYADLVRELLPLLAPDGLLLAVCNVARLPEADFARGLGRGGEAAGRPLRVIHRFGLPSDFPVPPAFTEGFYLKAFALQG